MSELWYGLSEEIRMTIALFGFVTVWMILGGLSDAVSNQAHKHREKKRKAKAAQYNRRNSF